MSAQPTVHRAKIAEARNVLGEVIARARFGGEPTILVNRGKDAAVIVSPEFYEQALRDRAIIDELHRRTETSGVDAKSFEQGQARAVREALHSAALAVDDS
ncbi:type II toxin-antitoxin system Phd/YefM family antitoxin [Streptomyces sp. NPDC021218]|uniref:type II toxin-antitoxin system Phd/YefM family antitoxin n=1 Tax=Streptomyces sp. NPDC021218 TaxID=3365119 RepID=UPI0037A2FBFD